MEAQRSFVIPLHNPPDDPRRSPPGGQLTEIVFALKSFKVFELTTLQFLFLHKNETSACRLCTCARGRLSDSDVVQTHGAGCVINHQSGSWARCLRQSCSSVWARPSAPPPAPPLPQGGEVLLLRNEGILALRNKASLFHRLANAVESANLPVPPPE